MSTMSSCISILLLLINFSSGLREEFYLTYEETEDTRCSASISRMDKGVKCCLDSDNDGSADVCTAQDSNDDCLWNFSSNNNNALTVDFETAKQTCLNRGAGYRLCTIAELSSSLCSGTECQGHNHEIWSSEGCTPVYYTYQFSTNSEGSQPGIGGQAAIRCCALNAAQCHSTTNSGDCYYTEIGLNRTTQDQASYTEAINVCESNDRMVCHSARLENNCKMSACGTNAYPIWGRNTISFGQTTWSPTSAPTSAPSYSPTNAPTFSPTDSPTNAPSLSPTNGPTSVPTDSPTNAPTSSPTHAPTYGPVETPVVPWGQFEADSNIMPSNASEWDNVFRLDVKEIDSFGISLEDGIDIRPDSSGKLSFLFAKSGIYKIEFRVSTDNTCVQRIELRPADDFSLPWVGQSSIIQSSSNTVSVSFIALISDTSQLYVIYQQRESSYSVEDCFTSQYRYDSVISWIYG